MTRVQALGIICGFVAGIAVTLIGKAVTLPTPAALILCGILAVALFVPAYRYLREHL